MFLVQPLFLYQKEGFFKALYISYVLFIFFFSSEVKSLTLLKQKNSLEVLKLSP